MESCVIVCAKNVWNVYFFLDVHFCVCVGRLKVHKKLCELGIIFIDVIFHRIRLLLNFVGRAVYATFS